MSALELIQLTRQLEEAEKRIAVLEQTLEFYATGFAKKLTESMMGQYTPALVDGGARARAALTSATTQAGEESS